MCAQILVVDDEPDVARGWARTLRLAGHNLLVANSPAIALQIATENPLDLVVLDYMMPEMSGIQLLNEIRKEHPFVRSIIISGKLDPGLSEESVLTEIKTDIEADRYLHKPVDNPKLREVVAALLEARTDTDWQAVAKAKLESSKTRRDVRSAERKLNKKRKK